MDGLRVDGETARGHDRSLFELDVRQLPSVVWVAVEEESDRVAVQVVTVDPLTSDATVGRIERLAERYYDSPVAIDVITSGAPSLPLTIEEALARIDGVINVAGLRGSRGEVISLVVSVRQPHVRSAVLATVERQLGCPLASERLNVTVADDADGASTFSSPRSDATKHDR